MAGTVVNFSSALEDCLNSIGQGESLGVCLARYPEFANKLHPYLETVVKMRESSTAERQMYGDIPADIPFKVALNHSIQMMMRGKTPEYCYTQYPEHAAELKPWLTAVQDVRENGGIGSVSTLDFPSDLLTPQVTYQQALEYCLNALERGVQPEVALSRYPYYADRLRIWVYYVATLQSFTGLKPAPPTVTSPKNAGSWVVFPKIKNYSYSFSNLALSLIFAIVFFLSGTGLIRASADSLPGQSLYPLKRTIEELQLKIAPSAEQDSLLAFYATERQQEISAAVNEGQTVSVEFQGKVLEVHPDRVYIDNFGAVYFQPGFKLPAVQPGTVVNIVVHADKQHGVSTNSVNAVPMAVAVVLPTATRLVAPTATLFKPPTPIQSIISPSPSAVSVYATSTYVPTKAPTSAPTSISTDVPTSTATLVPTLISTNTASPAPTDTRVPTDTPAPTNTRVPTNTPVPTDTQVPTNTAMPVPTDTAVPVPTNTAMPVPTDTAVPVPTNTAVPVPTNTAVPAPTDTAVPVLPTDIPIP